MADPPGHTDAVRGAVTSSEPPSANNRIVRQGATRGCPFGRVVAHVTFTHISHISRAALYCNSEFSSLGWKASSLITIQQHRARRGSSGLPTPTGLKPGHNVLAKVQGYGNLRIVRFDRHRPLTCSEERPCSLMMSVGSPSNQKCASLASSVSMTCRRSLSEQASRSRRTTTSVSPGWMVVRSRARAEGQGACGRRPRHARRVTWPSLLRATPSAAGRMSIRLSRHGHSRLPAWDGLR